MNIKNIKKITFILTTLFIPVLTFAQIGPVPAADGTLDGFFLQMIAILNGVLIITMGIALVTFLWGVLTYTFGSKGADDKTKSKNFIMWGIVGLFVMISVWGIVNILTGTFFEDADLIAPKQLPKL